MNPAPHELIVDLFAGGGGASTAIFRATGRHPDVAVNHNADAIGVHQANHPSTRHYTCDVHEVDPVAACTVDGELRPVGLLWASPDCTHFSKARGGKPVEKGIRSLADVVVVWARAVRPRLIHLENVEEFQNWGPVLENGQPCPERKGLDFRRWVKELQDLGYVVEWRELVAADYGAPTTRKRLFLIARCDGEPIRWPDPTHASREKIAKGDLFGSALKTWRAAAEIIDWSLPVPSIFDRKKPLADKTHARIAKGIRRFVVESPRPFIVPITNSVWGGDRIRPTDQPLRTITTSKGGEYAVAAPAIVRTDFKNTRASCVYPPEDALRTITSQEAIGVAAAFLKPRLGEREGQEPRALDIEEPYPTVVPGGNGGDLAAILLQKMAQNGQGYLPDEPVHTAMAGAPRHYEVAAYLQRQFGSTVSGRDLEEPAPTVMSDGQGGKAGVTAAYLEQANTRDIGAAADDPARTVTGKGHQGVTAVHLTTYYGGPGGDARGSDAAEPVRTIPTENRHGVVAAVLDEYYGFSTPGDVAEPLRTVTDRDRHGLNAAFLEQANTGMVGHSVDDPVSTIVGGGGPDVGWGTTQRLVDVRLEAIEATAGPRRRRVLEFLWKHFGEPTEGEWAAPLATLMGRLRFGLVILGEAVWQIADIGMRMLVPRELFNAQGFDPDYIIDRKADGSPVTKTAQTSMAGNSVSPPPAEATLRANLTWMALPERAAA
jgi:DNA (cytosine-5)-methyltransferase 1